VRFLSVVLSSVLVMAETGFDDWVDTVPWWVDAAADPEVAGADDDCSDTVPDEGLVGLSVAETLHEIQLSGPGPDAQRLLTALAGRELSADQWLSVVTLWEPQAAWLAGQQNTALVGFAGAQPPPGTDDRADYKADDWAVLELSCALGSTVAFAGERVATARVLATSLVRTGDLLRAGRLSAYKAWLLVDRLGELDPQVARDVEARVLPHAADDLPATLKRRLRRAIIKADPQTAERKHREGREARRAYVETEEREPGLLGVQAYLPPGQAIAVGRRLARKAAEFALDDRAERDAAGASDPPVQVRTRDQRMADALAWFVLGPDPDDARRPREPNVVLNVTIDLPTLVALRDNPADLGRFGTLPPQIARELAGDASWSRFVHEPVTGHLLDKGTRTYLPGKELDEYVRARDRTCRFPGETRRAEDCDLDHDDPFDHDDPAAGGSTSAENLAALSRRPHRAKTHGGFTYQHLGGGVLLWRTPLGRYYVTYPHDYRPDGDEDPPGR
jgi:Domain of unknown function (DUF222)